MPYNKNYDYTKKDPHGDIDCTCDVKKYDPTKNRPPYEYANDDFDDEILEKHNIWKEKIEKIHTLLMNIKNGNVYVLNKNDYDEDRLGMPTQPALVNLLLDFITNSSSSDLPYQTVQKTNIDSMFYYGIPANPGEDIPFSEWETKQQLKKSINNPDKIYVEHPYMTDHG